MVMPSNSCRGIVHMWAGRYPGLVGHLYSPDGFRGPYPWLPYALDNGAFSAWTHGRAWDASAFYHMLRSCQLRAEEPPRWVLAPDVVGNRDETLRLFDVWRENLTAYGPVALAIQDGMTPADAGNCAPDVLFIGGTTKWKRAQLRHLHEWRAVCPRIHLGRANSARWLWLCAELGIESADGTGLARTDWQLDEVSEFLAAHARGERRRSHGPLFDDAGCVA